MLRWIAFSIALCFGGASAAEPIRFSRDVKPILADNCLGCHGQDESHRMAGLRLDTREGAIASRKNGAAIVAGDPAASTLLARVTHSNAARVMPPPYSHKAPLTPAQVDILRQWIAEGAPWEKHWAFEAPRRRNGTNIDALIRERLATVKAGMSPAAPRATLAQRLAYDLTGLPASAYELNRFLSDPRPDAYARYVDRLLASPHFGERMAMWWLDAARYADTDGFQADDTRQNWPWRDWVVNAFNGNMPFDQFTREQFAGDLLPGATAEQKLATAFHRNHMTNGEGGRDPEESRIEYVMDRVNTMGSVWLGLTLGCTQCHSHKFDPISHRDYYSLNAFFNSVAEDGQAGKRAHPYLPWSSSHVARAEEEAMELLQARRQQEAASRRTAEPAFASWLAQQQPHVKRGYRAWHAVEPSKLESAEGTLLKREGIDIVATGPNPRQDDYRLIAAPRGVNITGLRLEVLPHASHTNGGLSRGERGEFLLTDVKLEVRRRGSNNLRSIAISSAVADYIADKSKNDNNGDVKDTLDDDPRNGWTTVGASQQQTHVAVFALAEALRLDENEELIWEMRHRSNAGGANIGRFRLFFTGDPGPAVRSVEAAPLEQLAALQGSMPDALRQRLFDQFLETHGPHREHALALQRAEKQHAEIVAAAKVNVMVLAERPEPRTTHVLLRGVWDRKGEEVPPAALTQLAAWPAGAPNNRLGLAQWLVSRDNPLTARVVANHLWQLVFGTGLVRTTEDFGLQGEAPFHQDVLDWLAVELMASNWDVKHTLRLIVNSQTYQQAATLTTDLQARDPENRWLARGPRFRLPAWMLRDAALARAGLLNPIVGGPPVRPYQPPGVWEELFMGRFTYVPSEGPAQYRRTLYAFWRRSIAPTFLFDSAQRRSCEVRVSRTNTPLQALTLLNDETYLEAARAIAAAATADPVGSIFLLITGRKAEAKERAALQQTWQTALRHYQAHPQEAAQLLSVGPHKVTRGDARHAAGMALASMVMNLDEVLTRE
jgi:hypothetical protein